MKLTDLINEEYSHTEEIQTKKIHFQSSSLPVLIGLYEKWIHNLEKMGPVSGLSDKVNHCENFIYQDNPPGQGYTSAARLLSHAKYSPEDITALSLQLEKYEQLETFSCSGSFLSAAVRIHQSKTAYSGTYHIITEHLQKKLHSLGFANEKSNIVIQGSTGDNTCDQMNGGRIQIFGNIGKYSFHNFSGGNAVIYGNAGNGLCIDMWGGKIIVTGSLLAKFPFAESFTRMRDGSAIIYGNCENAGPKMKGGNILIAGNCKGRLGHCMTNGTITLLGDGDEVGENMYGGTIRVMGELHSFLKNSIWMGEPSPYFKKSFWIKDEKKPQRKIIHKKKIVSLSERTLFQKIKETFFPKIY